MGNDDKRRARRDLEGWAMANGWMAPEHAVAMRERVAHLAARLRDLEQPPELRTLEPEPLPGYAVETFESAITDVHAKAGKVYLIVDDGGVDLRVEITSALVDRLFYAFAIDDDLKGGGTDAGT